MERIYTFNNGSQIDLKQIICIGKLDKSASNTIFIPVHCKGYNKPIEIVLGYSIGEVERDIKIKISIEYNDFIRSWNDYINNLI